MGEEGEKRKIIKMKPYCGQDNEIYKGNKTIIKLYSDRIEYKINYEQKIKITNGEPNIKTGEVELIDSFMFNNQEGMIFKKNISGLVKYVETDYIFSSTTPFKIYLLDIDAGESALHLSAETEIEQAKAYKEVYNWLNNIEETKENNINNDK